MTFNHSESLDNLASLDNFLTQASGPLGTTYVFDSNIAATFHTLLLSSLYYYLCSMMQLKLYPSEKSQDEQKIQSYVGLFCNAVKLYFLVSHSNAMRAYFTFVQLLVNYPNSEFSAYYKNEITAAICTKLHDLGWIKRKMEVEDSNDNDRDKEENDNNGDKEENYIEGSKGLDMMLVYRRALMSFVDHYAGLHILERRSIALLADENIKLSLIGIKHQRFSIVHGRRWRRS